MGNKKVLVVGELHQDLFYKNNAFSDLADELQAAGSIIALSSSTQSTMELSSVNNKQVRKLTDNIFSKNRILSKH